MYNWEHYEHYINFIKTYQFLSTKTNKYYETKQKESMTKALNLPHKH